MKTIPLTQGKFATVDDEDFDRIMSIGKWQFHSRGYAAHNTYSQKKKVTILMHRVVIDCPEGMQTDHKNMNKLDNRKENLRMATVGQNHCNRTAQKNNSTGIKGVQKRGNSFRAALNFGGKRVFNKSFRTPEEASAARLAAAVKFHGEFAR